MFVRSFATSGLFLKICWQFDSSIKLSAKQFLNHFASELGIVRRSIKGGSPILQTGAPPQLLFAAGIEQLVALHFWIYFSPSLSGQSGTAISFFQRVCKNDNRLRKCKATSFKLMHDWL